MAATPWRGKLLLARDERNNVRQPSNRTSFLDTVAETPFIQRAWRTMPLQRCRTLLFHDT